MKRELKDHWRGWYFYGCCPGHDMFPVETYSSNRSKRARARDKKVEHQLARSIAKRKTRKEVLELE